MVLSERVRVVYEEPPVDASGERPASVFLVGRQEGVYRIQPVVEVDDGPDAE